MASPSSPQSALMLARLREAFVVAVIRASSADAAVNASRAILRGGVTGIEIAFSTPRAEDAIAQLRQEFPEALLGAGTVLDLPMLDAAIAAGAEFVMSPHVDDTLVGLAAERGVPFIPGAFTPTEVFAALRAGACAVKLFPAAMLGPTYLSALRAPFGKVPLVPSGGVTVENLHEWLDAGAWAVGVGGSLVRGSEADMESEARRFVLARMKAQSVDAKP